MVRTACFTCLLAIGLFALSPPLYADGVSSFSHGAADCDLAFSDINQIHNNIMDAEPGHEKAWKHHKHHHGNDNDADDNDDDNGGSGDDQGSGSSGNGGLCGGGSSNNGGSNSGSGGGSVSVPESPSGGDFSFYSKSFRDLVMKGRNR